MRDFEHSNFLLGRAGVKPVGILGLSGIDGYSDPSQHPRDLPSWCTPDSKTTLSFGEQEKFQREHGIVIKRKAPGGTGGNLARSIALKEDERTRFFTTLAPSDPSTEVIVAELDKAGVDVHTTRDEAPDARNAYSLVLPPLTRRRIVVAKPTNAPLPQVENVSELGALVLAPLGGNWSGRVQETVAQSTGAQVPLFVVGSEGQIKQIFKDSSKKEAYLQAIHNATAVVLNFEEAQLLAAASGQSPERDVRKLGRQLRKVKNNGKGNRTALIGITLGENGAAVIDGDDKVYKMKVPKIDAADLGPVVSNIGAGDGFGGGLLSEIRKSGVTEQGIAKSLAAGMLEARAVIAKTDSQSGQLSRDKLDQLMAKYQGDLTSEVRRSGVQLPFTPSDVLSGRIPSLRFASLLSYLHM